MATRSPVLGYNTNVRHAGKLYHIQTEDSGLKHPHVITHLFADGGRIVASTKSSYAEHLGAEKLHDAVKQLMREQHKSMFIALRDGHYDDPGAHAHEPNEPRSTKSFEKPGSLARDSVSVGAGTSSSGHYQAAQPPAPVAPKRKASARAPSEPRLAPTMTLDEVILSYLAADLEVIPER